MNNEGEVLNCEPEKSITLDTYCNLKKIPLRHRRPMIVFGRDKGLRDRVKLRFLEWEEIFKNY